MGNSRTVVEIVRREMVSNYDYEDQLNEAKRPIKLIKKEYYSQILEEFNTLTKHSNMPWLRSPRMG
jgi:phosphoserine phosphatase